MLGLRDEDQGHLEPLEEGVTLQVQVEVVEVVEVVVKVVEVVEAVKVVEAGGGEEVHGEEQDLFERIGFQEPQSKGSIGLASQLQLVFHSWRQGRIKDHFTHSQNYSNPSFG